MLQPVVRATDPAVFLELLSKVIDRGGRTSTLKLLLALALLDAVRDVRSEADRSTPLSTRILGQRAIRILWPQGSPPSD